MHYTTPVAAGTPVVLQLHVECATATFRGDTDTGHTTEDRLILPPSALCSLVKRLAPRFHSAALA